jgi:uncharacterized protein YhbP (UPF0306 family)
LITPALCATAIPATLRPTHLDLVDIAKEIIDASLYLVLGTSDREGRPWASPVYFAHSDHREFFWVSHPEATHSRNIEARRDVSAVIFDSSAPINTGQGVYISAVAEQLAPEHSATGLEVYSRRAIAHGGRAWTTDDIQAPGGLRFYRARATAHYVLDEHDHRVAVSP